MYYIHTDCQTEEHRVYKWLQNLKSQSLLKWWKQLSCFREGAVIKIATGKGKGAAGLWQSQGWILQAQGRDMVLSPFPSTFWGVTAKQHSVPSKVRQHTAVVPATSWHLSLGSNAALCNSGRIAWNLLFKHGSRETFLFSTELPIFFFLLLSSGWTKETPWFSFTKLENLPDKWKKEK